jgi:hypothetical protein
MLLKRLSKYSHRTRAEQAGHLAISPSAGTLEHEPTKERNPLSMTIYPLLIDSSWPLLAGLLWMALPKPATDCHVITAPLAA